MKTTKKLLILVCSVTIVATLLSSLAHSGRTDSSGGHNVHKNGTYHYHNGSDRSIEYSSPQSKTTAIIVTPQPTQEPTPQPTQEPTTQRPAVSRKITNSTKRINVVEQPTHITQDEAHFDTTPKQFIKKYNAMTKEANIRIKRYKPTSNTEFSLSENVKFQIFTNKSGKITKTAVWYDSAFENEINDLLAAQSYMNLFATLTNNNKELIVQIDSALELSKDSTYRETSSKHIDLEGVRYQFSNENGIWLVYAQPITQQTQESSELIELIE